MRARPRRLTMILAGAMALARAVQGPHSASANEEQNAEASASIERAEQAEAQGEFDRAEADYRQAEAAAPETAQSARAAARLAWLRERAEGDFKPLARLERVRRDPDRASDPAEIDALADEVERFPPGQVRIEARVFVAEALRGRLGRPEAAIAQWRAVADDPLADKLTQRLSSHEIVEALLAAGHLDEAASEARARQRRLEPRFVGEVIRLVRRRLIRLGARFELGTFAVAVAIAVGRRSWGSGGALRDIARALRHVAPLAVAFCLYVAVVGGWLAFRFEAGSATPFLALGASALPITLAARAWGAAGSKRAPARLARAVLSAASILAAAFLVLDAVDPRYLDGFDL
jgi:hypothetical protein